MNFGGLLGIVAILAFGVGILGVAFAFTLASQGRSARGGFLLAVVGFAGGVVLFIVSSGILIVQPARAAVIVNVLSGELEDPARAPGTSIIIPGSAGVHHLPDRSARIHYVGHQQRGALARQ